MKFWAFALILALFLVIWFLPLLLGLFGIPLASNFTWPETLRSLVETAAIIVAGYWTYNRFIKSREDYPFPRLQHRIDHFHLKNGPIYLSVFVTVVNEGKTKLDLSDGTIIIRQVAPLPFETSKLIATSNPDDIRKGIAPDLFIDAGRRLSLDTLGAREWKQLHGKLLELEPGQTREIQFVFLIDRDVEVIEAISYFEYEEKKKISGWELATLYSLRRDTK